MLPCRRTRRAGPASFNRAADAWRKKDVSQAVLWTPAKKGLSPQWNGDSLEGEIQEKSTAEVGAHSGGWGRVWGRGRARAAAQTLSGPPGALRGPFLARPRPARPPRARLASLRCGGPLQPLGERPEGGGKR